MVLSFDEGRFEKQPTDRQVCIEKEKKKHIDNGNNR